MFQLGDKVDIQSHWKKTNVSINMDEFDIEKIHEVEDEDGHIKVIDEDLALVEVERLYKEGKQETGYICGVRYKNTKQQLCLYKEVMIDFFEYDFKKGIFLEESAREKLYMVAVNLNTIRYVSEEDMKQIS